MNKRLAVLMALLPLAGAQAAEDSMRLADRMLFKSPELTKPGACALYREGGAGWILVEPQYWLKGTVLSAAPKKVVLQLCPLVAGKPTEQYSRDEFNRLAKAQPCVAKMENSKEVELGFIRFRVEDWETPWAKTAANAGRLFQGHYLDQKLHKGLELELQADLLTPCP